MPAGKTACPHTTRGEFLTCPPNKHCIELWLTCEQFDAVQEASQFVGCGTDLERYIIRLIMEHC